MWVRIPPGAAHLKKRESEMSQVVLLCCLALFIVSQLFNHVHVRIYVGTNIYVYINMYIHVHMYA